MESQKSQSIARRGSVQIKNSNGSLQLVFSHPIITPTGELKTKRFYLSTRHDDTPFGRHQASALATKIQRDIDYGEFDASLVKYKPAASLSTVTPITPITPSPKPQPDLGELWEKYAEFKKPQVSPSTYAVDYRKYRNHIANLPTKTLDDAIAIRDYLVAHLSANAAKRTLTNINACCDWALKSQLIESNPFPSMAKDIQIPKSESAEYEINPFSKEERDSIIQAFEESKLYSYYAPCSLTLSTCVNNTRTRSRFIGVCLYAAARINAICTHLHTQTIRELSSRIILASFPLFAKLGCSLQN
ncbi:MAG: hypothetical protein V7K25_01890 [Nostoc sp.]|uniref:Arm DNA-binding domain-containing protein n=1 Tax=Nostoc sp. TaxID=1180 RepID=UPI002FF46220